MMRSPRRLAWTLALVAACCASAGGCSSFWHDMQLHRLHRFNRHPPAPSDEFNNYFSVPDPPLPTAVAEPGPQP